MSRVEFLKKFVAFNKKHKVPTPIIKAQLYVILIVCFIHYAIVKGIRAVKNFICSPFIKLHKYIKENMGAILQMQCLLATIGICCLLIAQHGGVNVEESTTGALFGEVYSEGDIMGTTENDQQKDGYIPEVTTGAVTNQQVTQQENTTEAVTQSGNDVTIGVDEQYPYKIMVNRLANCITVYTLDEDNQYTVPYKAMICSTGGENTPLGTFKISTKYDFKTLFYKSYGQYASRIYGSILFHSSGYDSMNKDDLNVTDFNNLGEGVSHGCIRLTVADAKWIFDNCPSGTEVVIYDNVEIGPLGKPEAIKVPEGTNWDPTDPDENNPWHKNHPRIEGIVERVFYEGDIVDYMEGIVAYDTCGNIITDDVVVEGEVDISIPGEYTIRYKVTDLLGKTAEETVIYTVK